MSAASYLIEILLPKETGWTARRPGIGRHTPSRVDTTALLDSRSRARMIFARNVSAAGSERDRVMAKRCALSSLEIVSVAFGRPVRIG
ncbi:hypothetical protein [Bradyrhizobium sp. AUGA SZCCT0283]|uniref:hypothetical protein n=1 Tax=Bradyrhizobium sp. AUGA SZCCT0283 TaxID=2807671 RepID=UPI001BA9CC3E|nr:hypothetical protein [Bradyrhizobium sp. AUGA SZCCT0283]MBR1279017.1 hypothetical protein [Bradyrhizobium sp. AUGA SZCCT0283]